MKLNYEVYNLRQLLESEESVANDLVQEITRFSCQKNPSVEAFLLHSSLEFTKKNQSVTYLVLSPSEEIVGYFTLSIKPIRVNTELFSKTIKKKIARVGKETETEGEYSLAAYLIAQLGKNESSQDTISGKQLLQCAIDKIYDLQYAAGGMVMFLESENHEKLLDFYIAQNGFKIFDIRKRTGEEDTDKLVQMLRVM